MIINYDEFRRVRGHFIDGELYLYAKDVATIIGVQNSTECLKCSPQNIKEFYSFRGVKRVIHMINSKGIQEFITISNCKDKKDFRKRFKEIFKGAK